MEDNNIIMIYMNGVWGIEWIQVCILTRILNDNEMNGDSEDICDDKDRCPSL
jgi:hypothetical protein